MTADLDQSALFTALSALDLGAGDELFVGPYTFVATAEASRPFQSAIAAPNPSLQRFRECRQN